MGRRYERFVRSSATAEELGEVERVDVLAQRLLEGLLATVRIWGHEDARKVINSSVAARRRKH